MLMHTTLFVVMALSSFPELPGADAPTLDVETVALERPDSLDLLDLAALELESVEIETASVDPPELSGASAPQVSESFDSSDISAFVNLSSDAISAPVLGDSTGVAGVGVMGRAEGARESLVLAKGGSRATEVAVARGLKWIAEHQNPNGTWSLVHTAGPCRGRCDHPARISNNETAFERSLTSGTALALLPFLGAGETHLSGRHKRVVERGLDALIRLGKPDDEAPGASWMDSGRLYAHGISAIVLCEAYGMTRDPQLKSAAQASIDYLAHAQDPAGGGWRYRPQQPGDTSVTGWQIMALKSAQLAELDTPRRVVRRATRFLNSTQSINGQRYGYLPPEGDREESTATRTLTAVGLLCRMYLGWDQEDERLKKGAEWLVERGPHEGNYYHNYYAAQTLFHLTGGEGPMWREWNEPMREQLINQQETRGHARGSWWVEGPHNERGGRLYMTALATMTLEVYYRYLPLYRSEAVQTELPD